MAQMVKHLPTVQKNWVHSLGPGLGRSPGEGHGNPIQYSSWKIPRTEEPGGLQSMGSQGVGHD